MSNLTAFDGTEILSLLWIHVLCTVEGYCAYPELLGYEIWDAVPSKCVIVDLEIARRAD